jgi:hypothetical protein
VNGATPTAAIAATAEYTATISWWPADVKFGSATVYTAVITVTPKTGYTLKDVPADFFTVAGAATTNAAESGIVSAVFPATATTIGVPAIAGVTVPVAGAAPVSTLSDGTGYTAAITWLPLDAAFAPATAYTAIITITPKSGYTLTGVPANFFTVADATATNGAESGTVTAVFPATAATIAGTAIAGVTVPAVGATPVTTATETPEYTASVTWSPADVKFMGSQVYTAAVTLTPKPGYTLVGVTANQFAVAGAAATNAANSGVVTAVFPATATTINTAAIAGVTVPITGATPVSTLPDGTGYTAVIAWSPVHAKFAFATSYTATITLTPKTGYTLDGVTADQFTVSGAAATNAANSGLVTAVFPATASTIAGTAISGVTAPVTGTIPVTVATETSEYTASVSWSPSDAKYVGSKVYTATITLTPKTGYTLVGVLANQFTVAGATATNAVDSGVVTALFPVTATTINADAIAGVTVPVTGATPVSTLPDGTGYTAAITWSPVHAKFASATIYTATITITPKSGYTLSGVSENFFTVAGATAANAVDSGVVTALFPVTETTINTAAIAGVTVPVTGATPVSTLPDGTGYTAAITWSPVHAKFASATIYTATVTITPKSGYTLSGVPAKFFTVAGATATNAAESGFVTAVFPVTAATINTAAIAGVSAPTTGATPVSTLSDGTGYTAAITWSPLHAKFASATVYTATITLTPKSGYTLSGVSENFFTVAGATATNAVDSGVVTALFPVTATTLVTPDITGVTSPVTGTAPISTLPDGTGYTAAITWAPVHAKFASATIYTATITITPKSGYTLSGVSENFFTVAGATAANAVDSGVVTALFPVTDTTIGTPDIAGVTAPVTGATPLSTLPDGTGYAAAISWSPVHSTFVSATIYTATVTITPKTGYTLSGVSENFFTVAGATATNATDSGAVTALFPVTATTINTAAIAGVTAPVTGATPGSTLPDGTGYTAALTWSPVHSTFASATVYTATITITPKPGYTLSGVSENFFTVASATATNAADSGLVTAAFPPSAPMLPNRYQIATGANPDAATDALGNVFVVYERAGNVYLEENRGNEGLISAGSGVVIAVDSLNDIHLLYINGGLKYKKRTGSVWGAERAVVANAVFYSIDTDGSNVAHVAYEADNNIAYVKDNTGTWDQVLTLTADAGNLYHQPIIRIGTTGDYHLAYEKEMLSTGRLIVVESNSGYGTKSSIVFDSSTVLELTSKALSLDGTVAYIAYTAGSTMYIAKIDDSWTVQKSFAGSAGTICFNSTKFGSAYDSSGVKYVENHGNGVSLSAALDSSGSNSVVAFSSVNRYVYYEKSSNIWLASDKDIPGVIGAQAITGVTVPARGATPVTSATATAEYTASVAWLPAHATFASATAYTATITLTPKLGYTLSGVSANFFTVAGATTVTNPADSGIVTAVFPHTTALITSSVVVGNGSITPTPSVTVGYGANQTFTITPDIGYHITEALVDNSPATLVNNQYTFENISADHNITASFAVNDVQIATNVSSLDVNEGSTATFQVRLTAQPMASKTVAVSKTSGEPDISVTVGASLTFTSSNWGTYQSVTVAAAQDADALNGSATITCSSVGLNNQTVTVNEIDDDTTLTVTNDGYGTTTPSGAVVVTKSAATPIGASATGYHFVNWTITSGAVIFGDAGAESTTATITAPATIRANFAINTYTLASSVIGEGYITPGETVNYGASKTFTISPYANYHITDVLVDGGSVGAVPSYTFTSVAANHTIEARFAFNQDGPINLSLTSTFAVLAGTTIVNTGASALAGDIGVSPGIAVTGFPPGTYTGTQHLNDAVAIQCKFDLANAYGVAAARTQNLVVLSDENLGGETLSPGLYRSGSGSFTITGSDLTLDGEEDANAVWVFQMPSSTLTVGAGLKVLLINGANAHNIFWQVNGSVTIGSNAEFEGTIMADQSITMETGAKLNGRALSMNGQVTLDTNNFTTPPAITITASAGMNGLITPSGTVEVHEGSQSFTITPDTGYHVADVLVDGVSVGAVTSYDFLYVTASHLISATFAINDVQIATDVNTLNVNEGSTASFQVKLTVQPTSGKTVAVSKTSGDPDISVSGGGSLSFNTSNWNTYQTVTIAAAQDADTTNGTATITCSSSGSSSKTVTVNEVDNDTTLTVTSGGGGSTSPSGATLVTKSAATSISASASTGYHFVNWTVTSGSATIANASSASTTATISDLATVRANFAINTYSLSYAAGANGTVSGTASQTVSYGGSGSAVTAVPNTGYHFVKWSDNVTTAARTDSNVTGNINVTASFAISSYSLAYIAGANGSISGNASQTVAPGSNGSVVTAVPNTGYHFVKWSDNVVTASRTDTNVTGNISVTASFAANDVQMATNVSILNVNEGSAATFQVKLTAQPVASKTVAVSRTSGDSGISVTGGAILSFTTANWNTYQTVTVTSAQDADIVNGIATITCSSTGSTNQSVTVNNLDNDTTLTVTSGGNGTTNPSGATLVTKSAATAISATANTGYSFDIWTVTSGAATFENANSANTKVTITEPATIQANFTVATFTLTSSSVGEGFITSSEMVNYGTSKTFTIYPYSNYHLADVLVDGVSVGAVTSYIFSNVTAAHTIEAVFAVIENGPIQMNLTSSFSVLAGTAINNTGNTALYGDIGVSPGSTVTGFPPGTYTGAQHLNDSTAISAKFDLANAYTAAAARTSGAVTISDGKLGGKTLSPGIYKSGTGSFTLTGSDLTLDGGGNANAVWVFQSSSSLTVGSGFKVVTVNGANAANIYWQVGGSASLGTNAAFQGNIMAYQSISLQSGAKLNGRALAQNGSVTLNNNNMAVITVAAAAGANGSITPNGTVPMKYGASQSFTITPAAHYHITDVLIDGENTGAASNSYDFIYVTANHTISASFAIDRFELTSAAGANGSITPSATVDYGTDKTFTIIADAQYRVADVLVDYVSIGAVTSYEFKSVAANHTISASFEFNTFALTSSSIGEGFITASETVNYGASKTFTIYPLSNYHLSDVKVDGVSVGAVSSYTFANVTAAHTIEAVFGVNEDGPIQMNLTSSFSVLAGTAINNTGNTTLAGDIGVSPGSTVTGFPPGTYTGNQHLNDSTAVSAKLDLANAYAAAAARKEGAVTISDGELGGRTLAPGVYKSVTGSFTLTGSDLTLDGGGNVNVVWVFQSSSSLAVGSGFKVVLVNGANAANIYWQVGGSAAIGANASFQGNIMAYQSISLQDGAKLNGRALALNGAVTLNTNSMSVITITAFAGPYGSIDPVGIVSMKYGANQSFTLTPDLNYHVSNVLIDGVAAVPANRYDFTYVTVNHTISATFAINTYTVTYTAGAGGTISGNTSQTVTHGADATVVTAVPGTDCYFTEWSDGLKTLSRQDKNVIWSFTATASFTDNVMSNGSSISDLSGLKGSYRNFVIKGLSGQKYLKVDLKNISGDCDLYLRHASQATLQLYSSKSTNGPGLDESITVLNPLDGDWYILVYGFDDYSGAVLSVAYGTEGLDAPKNLTATKGSYDAKIVLTWDTVPGATCYEIFRGDVNNVDLATKLNSYWVTESDTAGKKTYNDTFASSGTYHYYYWVRALDGVYTSAFSLFAEGQTAPVSTISLSNGKTKSGISGLAGSVKTYSINVPASQTYLEIKISGVTGDCDFDVIDPHGTTVKRKVGGSSNELVQITGNPLISGAWLIRLYGVTDYSNLSLYVKYSKQTAVPGAPSGVKASDGQFTDRIVVTWNATAGAIAYTVGRKNNKNDANFALEFETNDTVFEDKSADVLAADPGTLFYYSVKAKNVLGYGKYSAANSGYRMKDPANPNTITASDGTYFDRINVKWSKIKGATFYEVWRSNTADSIDAKFLSKTTEISYDNMSDFTNDNTVRPLNRNTDYYYFIKAGNENENSTTLFSKANVGKLSTKGPASITASRGSYFDKVTVSWAAVTGATSYEVYRDGNYVGDGEGIMYIDVPGDTNTHKYQVKAKYKILYVSDFSGTASGYAGGAWNPNVTALTNGVPSGNIVNMAKGSSIYFSFDVPVKTSRLVATLSGTPPPIGSNNGDLYAKNDCDLFAKFANYPTKTSYTAKGVENTESEVLTVSNPSAGTWFFLLYGTTAYSNITLTVNSYSTMDVVFTEVPQNDLPVPFTAKFKGKVVVEDETGEAGIPNIVLKVRNPLTGLTSFLTKTDSKGVFSYSTTVNTEGEHTFDFFFTEIPDSAKGTASHTVATRKGYLEPNNYFDFSAYLPATPLELTHDDVIGMQTFLNIRNGWTEGAIDPTFENMWIEETLAAAPADTKLAEKLDAGLYMFFYGVEGASVGNNMSIISAFSAVPFVVRVASDNKEFVLGKLKAQGIIDETQYKDIHEKNKTGVVTVATRSSATEEIDGNMNISLLACEQLEILANLAGSSILRADGDKYSDILTKQATLTISSGREINVLISAFVK